MRIALGPPWKVTRCNTIGQHFCVAEQGRMSYSKLIGHIWLHICVYNTPLWTEGTLKGHRPYHDMALIICISNELWSNDEPVMRYNHTKMMWPWLYLLRSSKVKGHKVNWNIIYDFVYVLHIIIGHSMHRFWYIGLSR